MNWLSNAIAGTGKFLGIPEMGISEYFGGQPAPKSNAQVQGASTNKIPSGVGAMGKASSYYGGYSQSTQSSSPTSAPSAQQPNPFAGAEDAARAQAEAALAAENSAFDYNREQLQAQTGQAEGARGRALSTLGLELDNVKNTVGRSKKSATDNYDQQTQDARGSAQDIQRQNRNTLRALGILGSSAAGELLQKPMNEFDRQRARLTTAYNDRVGQLDDFLNQKTSEHSNAVKEVEAQYADLIGNIQRDLRFNDRQRLDAVRSANAALKGRLADIQQSMFQWNTQVETMKKNFAMQLAQMNNYQNPTADLDSIMGQVFTPEEGGYSPTTIGLAQDDEKRKSGLLSSLA